MSTKVFSHIAVILFVRGYRPFLELKYDTFSHRNFRISGDGDVDMFDVSALITEHSTSYTLDVPDRGLYTAEIDTNAPVIGVQSDVFDRFFDNDNDITKINGLPYSDDKNSQNNQNGKDDKDMTTPAEEYLKEQIRFEKNEAIHNRLKPLQKQIIDYLMTNMLNSNVENSLA